VNGALRIAAYVLAYGGLLLLVFMVVENTLYNRRHFSNGHRRRPWWRN
jgi:hypothetical protein